jgi:hypothetical protein
MTTENVNMVRRWFEEVWNQPALADSPGEGYRLYVMKRVTD